MKTVKFYIDDEDQSTIENYIVVENGEKKLLIVVNVKDRILLAAEDVKEFIDVLNDFHREMGGR